MIWANLSLQFSENKDVNISEQLNRSYVTEIESFRSLAGNSDADKLKAFIDDLNSGVDVSDESIVLSPSSDKSHRTVSPYHVLVHSFFWKYPISDMLILFRQFITFSRKD